MGLSEAGITTYIHTNISHGWWVNLVSSHQWQIFNLEQQFYFDTAGTQGLIRLP